MIEAYTKKTKQMNKQQFLAMSAITDLKGFVDGRSTNAGQTMYTLHSVPNKCKTVQIASTMDEDEFYIDIDKFKPILHPLPDLTKPIEYNGETFVPIEKLNELFGYEEIRLIHYINSGLGWNITSSPSNTAISFLDMYSPIQKLIEWHFDIAHLIENGEAVDVNTLDTNPYT